ncbi:hypothetical protein J3R82DRAFT_4834 [Butyriboletus roseoflavus]|nr:hypothetical protein J3R82DRAFT_4834 [Butyriboletus roseoflavus]
MILFEIIWFFALWILWIGTAGDTVAGKAYHFPAGCIYDSYPTTNQICNEFTVVEAFAFLNFFCAFVYYDVIFLYAIINAIRGKGIWTISVKEAAAVTPSVPVVQPQFNAAPAMQYQNYGAYPANVLPTQPYNAYPHQIPPQGSPTQPYYAYPQQAPPQGPYPQQYNAYPQQAPAYGTPIIPPSQIQLHNLLPPNAPQQPANYVGYSPSPPTNDAPLPSQPSYTSYPTNSFQAQLPLPSGYQGHPIPPQQQLASQSSFGSHPLSPV